MSEFEDAKRLADKVLDTPFRDPDDDLSMMCRQFNRAVERAEAAEREVARMKGTTPPAGNGHGMPGGGGGIPQTEGALVTNPASPEEGDHAE